MSEVKQVLIPINMEGGPNVLPVDLNWHCPVCGGPRGHIEIYQLDGNPISHWLNPCGHQENDASAVINEAARNGLNTRIKRCPN